MNPLKRNTMKIYYKYMIMLGAFCGVMACEDVSDMAITRVVSPVVLMVYEGTAGEVTATFYELDKSGILDKEVGIDSIAVADLSVDVFTGDTSFGTFVTDSDGKIVVSYVDEKPNEYVGVYKDIAFRIIK